MSSRKRSWDALDEQQNSDDDVPFGPNHEFDDDDDHPAERTADEEDKIPIDLALSRISSASRLAAKHREFEVAPYIAAAAAHGFQEGFDSEQLRTLFNIITSPTTQLTRSNLTTVLKNLFPKSRVADPIVYLVVRSIGPGSKKPAAAVQVLLLRWLISVYDVLETPKTLGKLYGALFCFLDLIGIRAPLCHLLAILTRRKHIRRHRIHQLLELCYKSGNEPSLVGMLRLYKDYYPEIVLPNAIAVARSRFREHDPEWRDRLAVVQARASESGQQSGASHSHLAAAGLGHSAPAGHHPHGFRIDRGGITGKQEWAFVPKAASAFATDAAVTLEEVDSAAALVRQIELVEPPAQMVSALRDPLVQKFMIVRAGMAEAAAGAEEDGTVLQRLELWLARFFEDEVAAVRAAGEPADGKYLAEMLRGVATFARATHELPQATATFLEEYLKVWDGETNVDLLLEVIQYVRPDGRDDIQQAYFAPLEAKLSAREGGLARFIHLGRNVLLRWASLYYGGSPGVLFNNSKRRLTPHTVAESFYSLANRLSHLSLAAVAVDPADTLAICAVQQLYRLLPTLSHNSLFPTSTSTASDPLATPFPPPSLVHFSLFEASLPALSSLGATLATYKPILSLRPPSADNTSRSRTIRAFNDLGIETLGLIWRSKAFPTSESSFPLNSGTADRNKPSSISAAVSATINTRAESLREKAGEGVRVPPVGSTYSLTLHPALVLYSNASFDRYFWKKLGKDDPAGVSSHLTALESMRKRHHGYVSSAFFQDVQEETGAELDWMEFRTDLLKRLAGAGAAGVGDLLKMTLRTLR